MSSALSDRLSMLDRRLAGSEDVVVLGPLRLPALGDLRRAAGQLAQAYPQARLDSLLDDARGRWRPRGLAADELGEQLVLHAPHLDPDALGFGGFARHVGAMRPSAAPVVWVVAGDWLAMAVSHAVGDAELLNTLAAGLVETAVEGRVPEPPARRYTSAPLLRASVHHWGRRPSRAVSTIAAVRRVRSRADVAPTVDAHATAAPTAVHAVTTEAATAQLRAWVREHAREAAPLAVQTLLAHRALQVVGLAPAPHAVVLYDVRAYLPTGLDARGNFAIGVSIPLGSPSDLDVVDAAIREAFDTGRPLTALAAGRVKQVLAGLPAAPARWRGGDEDDDHDGDETAPDVAAQVSAAPQGAVPAPSPVLVVTSLGRRAEVERLPWREGPDQRCFSALNDPAPGQVTFASTHLAGRRQHSLSFDPGRLDAAAMARAVELMATDPVPLLAASSPA